VANGALVMSRLRWPQLLKLATFVAIVGFLVWFGGPRDILDSMSRVGVVTVTLAFVISVLTVALNSAKWRLVLPDTPFLALLKIALISQFYSFFFFGQASGEVAKVYMLSRTSGNVGGAAASLFIDRLTSFLGLLLVSILGFALSSSTYPSALRETAIVVLVVLAALLVAIRQDAAFALAERTVVWVERTWPRLQAIAETLRKAIVQWRASIASPSRLLFGIALGAIGHVGTVVTIALLAQGIGIYIDPLDWCWIAGLMGMAGLVPISVGQATAGGALVGLLHILGVPVADAVALSALILVVNFLLSMLGALLEWRRIRALSESSQIPPGEAAQIERRSPPGSG
jgi:uncharacterized protein (TIRG00374 family)